MRSKPHSKACLARANLRGRNVLLVPIYSIQEVAKSESYVRRDAGGEEWMRRPLWACFMGQRSHVGIQLFGNEDTHKGSRPSPHPPASLQVSPYRSSYNQFLPEFMEKGAGGEGLRGSSIIVAEMAEVVR